jgi:hypothetical protein
VTDLNNPAGFVVSEPRFESNSATDFLDFVLLLVVEGVLVPGDFLVVDNAPIHFSEDIEDDLERVLAISQVGLFLNASVFANVSVPAGHASLPALLQSGAESCRAPVCHGERLDAQERWPTRLR